MNHDEKHKHKSGRQKTEHRPLMLLDGRFAG
jgi:hypothetical protein